MILNIKNYWFTILRTIDRNRLTILSYGFSPSFLLC
nr:MAG TPA: hypothetical protein [Caudoviricetes sp.]